MSKKNKQDSFAAGILPEIKAEKELMLLNGLSEALFGNFPMAQGSLGTQLSQTDTLFANNRWYLVSNMRQLLSEVYVEHGLIQTLIDVPVDDGLRGGVEIKSKQLSPEEIEALQIYVDREDILDGVIGRALKWNRLYGGAGILIMTDQDPKEPLNIEAIGPDTPLEFRAVDMWELFWDKQGSEGYDPEIQEHHFDYFNYYAKKIHKSRVMRMKGLIPPSFIRPRLRGWGFSIVEAVVRSFNQYLKANNLSFEVLDEFKVDIFKFKGLANTLLSATGEAQVRKRISIANKQKNYNTAVALDAEDDFTSKQLSFSGLAETMKEIKIGIASDLRMPLTKIFGVSSAGFNSGEDDIEVYNAMVESQVRNKCKYDILKVLEIICQKEYGYVPDDLQITFKPLRVLSAEQEENVKTQKFNRLLAARSAGEIDQKFFINCCNKDNLFSVPCELEEMNLVAPGSDEADNGPNVAEANREDSRKQTATVHEYGGQEEKPPALPTEGETHRPAVQLQPKKTEEAKEPKEAKS